MKSIKFRKVSKIKAKSEISNFIIESKQKGVKTLSALDIVLKLSIPANQVEDIMGDFRNEKRIKEING